MATVEVTTAMAVERPGETGGATKTELSSGNGLDAELDADILDLNTDDIITRNRLLENDIRVMKSEILRLQHEASSMKERLQDNLEKIKLNKQLPYLVANIVEILDVDPEDDADEEGANVDLDSVRKGKCAVVKTSTRTVLKTYYATHADRRRSFPSWVSSTSTR